MPSTTNIAQNLRDNNDNWIAVKQAIENKGVSTTGLTTAQFADAIGRISGGSEPVLTTLNVTPSTSSQHIEPPSNVDGYDEVNVAAVTASVDDNIVASNIKAGVQILGVLGEYAGSTPDYQDKVVTPSATDQDITADSGKTLRKVTVEGDANLISANIKKNVTLFNIVGSYEGSNDAEIFNEPTSLAAAPVTAWERQLVEYNNKLYYVVKGGNIYEYDDANDTLTSIYSNSDLFGNNGNNYPYMGVMVGSKLIWNYSNISGLAGYKAYDFVDGQITTLAQNLNNTYPDYGNQCSCITTDGFNIYYMDTRNLKIWKLDIATFTPSLVCAVTEYFDSMVYREGYLYGVRGDYIYRVDIANQTCEQLFTIGTAHNSDYYSSLVADTDYIYLVGGYAYDNNNAYKIWRFNDSSDYELIHTYSTAKFRQTSLIIHRGGLYGINSNRYESGTNMRKIGTNFKKDFS